MALTESLRILITANGAQAEREFAKVGSAAQTGMGRAETSTRQFGRNLVSAGVGIASFAGIALYGLQAAAQAAAEEELAVAKLNNTISNSPALAGASTDAFLDQAAALQDTTKFADDATIGLQALLGQFGLTQDQILQLTPLVLDLSSKMGISLEAAAKAVGRATQGTSGGLSRMIGQFELGDSQAENFAATVDALATRVGGFAEQEGQNLNGQLAIVRNNLGDVAEEVGRSVTPAMVAFTDALGEATPLLERATPLLEGMAGSFEDLGSATDAAVGFFDAVVGSAEDIIGDRPWLQNAIKTAFENLNPIGAASNVWGAVTGGFESLESVLDDQVATALEGSVLRSHALVAAQADIVVAAAAAEAGMADLADGVEGASAAVQRLGDEWNGLSNNLSQFDAATAAQDALFGFRDAIRDAYENGRIGAREMVDLRQAMSRLVGAAQRSAEAQATAADGTVNYARRNRILRDQLAGLAAFIPAALLPQFRNITGGLNNIPTEREISIRLIGADGVIQDLQRIHGEAQNAAAAVNQISGSLAGGGSYGGQRSVTNKVAGPRRVVGKGEDMAERIADRIATRLSKTPTPVYMVGN